ncbi:proliferation marker protein Ki-67-like [Parambassis ranga]|uniref:Proliferation marker protein Ki-67-like n=1 Tax=Parambassis ranga TaxID=210632 RepID=A0A6P7K0I3_9TELE|nr:proliferation marker protein Ki-67-like [Parambassis ranga]
MAKKSLEVKTPWKSFAGQPQTPSSKRCTPRPGSVRKNAGKPFSTEVKSIPKNDNDFTGAETPQCVKKQRKSIQSPSAVMARPEAENITKHEATSPQRKPSTPLKFSVHDVIEHISNQTPKSPMRRRCKEATPAKDACTGEQQAAHPKSLSPSNSGKAEKVSKKRKSGELGADLPASLMKKKPVSFGGYLSPELFDKRLPPDSPLRKGAAPRRSLSLLKPKQSLLRRASVIGLLKLEQKSKTGTPSPKKSVTKSASPKTPKSRTSSPKSPSPA